MASLGSYTTLHHEAHVSCSSCGLKSQSFDACKRGRSPDFSAASTSVKWRDSSRFFAGVSGRSSEYWGGDCRQLDLETGDSASGRRRGDLNSVRAMAVVEKKSAAPGRFYFNVTGFPFPLGPFLQRRTIRKEVRIGFRNSSE